MNQPDHAEDQAEVKSAADNHPEYLSPVPSLQGLRIHVPRIAAALLLVTAGFLLRGSGPSAEAQTPSDKPVAIVGDEKIYEKDFLPQLEAKIFRVRQQEYEVKRQALEDVINQKLLRAEADMWSMTPEDLLKQETAAMIGEPTDAEVEQRFVQQMFQGGQLTQSQDEIREVMKKEAAQMAHAQYFAMLRQKSGAKIFLLPPAHDVDYDASRVRGNSDAKITIVEFSDFQCPYCEIAYSMVKGLLKKYDGKVKLAYRDLPLQEIQAGIHGAGEASRCAGEQGKFWEYHDVLFENQDEYGPRAFQMFADTLGLDAAQFSACMESGKFSAAVKKDFDEGIRLGATGTPAFFINGIFINGARPQIEFETIIDALLESAG